MTELYQTMLRDLGKPEYDRLIAKHGLGGGLMKHDSTEALACYREMEMVPEARSRPLHHRRQPMGNARYFKFHPSLGMASLAAVGLRCFCTGMRR